ncbi:MAG: alpha/beta fold hydrolase [Gaiellaceae bacterium]
MILAVAAAAAALAGTPAALHLKPCVLPGYIPARCGTLAVREDRRASNGGKIGLFVGVLRAYGPLPHSAPIFWLSGGPGGAAASDDAAFAASTLLAANRTRDIVLVDQRGVGKSAPLLCPTPSEDLTETEARTYAEGCLRKVRRDPRLYTTDAAMDDVDAVRQALGYRKIVLYGGSYGATAGQVYLARHGAHVAAAVLDGATLLDVPIWEQMPRSTQRAFDRLAARCALDAACHAVFPDVTADLRTVFARLRSAPLDVRLDGSLVPFRITDAQETLRALLRFPAGTARVPLILHRAADGDYSELITSWIPVRAEAPQTAVKLMYWAIVCSEGWSRNDPAEVARLGAETEFLETALAGAHTLPLICGLLGPPLPAPDTGVVPRSRVPVLFLVGGMGPQDPLENVADASRSLPNSQILVVPGAGHGSLQLGCVPRIVMRFFSTHRLSSADRACAAAVLPPPFAMP